MDLVQNDFFYPDRTIGPKAMSLDRLLIFAVLMCRGTAEQRAQAFWNIVQDADHEFIAANDKDLYPVFQDIIEMCAILLEDWAKRSDVSAEIE